ncbi:di-trans,poly-cis-decaprenylcistransferase [Microgenomates group bacterium RIFCSPHIGHO2_01_FULL_45_11]|nr:MAG: di-trans,poly-cis-decaprenylcistransferase [Microgenomates group bacterium RIFCSPHIGHO2_01_FULL_45_11]
MRLSKAVLPQHVAIIMDGNRRWAAEHKLAAVAGHKKVVEEVVERLIDHVGHLGIPYLTLWAWNVNNWQRPKVEIAAIMQLFRWALKNRAERFIVKGARLRVIGDTSKFPKDIQQGLREMMEKSAGNTKITVTYGLNYGGHDEIVRAVNKILESRITNHESREEDKLQATSYKKVTSEEFSLFLDTSGTPDPDVIIRTGGDQRLSGFLPWQSEHSELYFTDTLMPDFDEGEFDKALVDYQKRQRRYGGGAFLDYQVKKRRKT